MIRVGIIGMGFMGATHLRNWQALEGVEVVAVCDANPILGKAKQGNIDTGDDELNLEGVSIYTAVADMLKDETLDAVSVTLPTHLHKPIAIQCLEAGVHVLCEKPMALSTADCDAMIAAADAAGKRLMIGQCIRFWPEYVWAKQAVAGGEFGALKSAEFSRLTYAPTWDADSWFADQSKSGGIALDLHIHDLDFVSYLLGTPEKTSSELERFESGLVGRISTTLDYPNDLSVKTVASWMEPESFGFQMAFSLEFEQARAEFDGTTLSVVPVEGESFVPDIGSGDGYAGEVQHFAALLSGSVSEAVITAEDARESVRLALETVK